VNKTSNIILTPQTRKMGRTITEIRFKIAKNPQLSILELDDGEGVRNDPVYMRLIGQGASDRLARQWINEHGAGHVAEKLAYVAARKDVQNPVSYLTAALRDNYAPVDRAGAALTTDRARHLKRITELVAARSPTQRDADKRLFMGRIEGAAARLDFENHGWMSALNAEQIVVFWVDLSSGTFDG
jgi:hypothetical protein